jgi:hypothetical protein
VATLLDVIRETAECLGIVQASQAVRAEDQAVLARSVDSALSELAPIGYIWWVDNTAIPLQAVPALARYVSSLVASTFYAGDIQRISAYKMDGKEALGDLEFMRPIAMIISPPTQLS